MTPRLIVITILITAFVSTAYGMGIYLFVTLVPDMRGDLGLTQEMIGRISGLSQGGTIVASLCISLVWGRIGARNTLIAVQAVIALAMVGIGLSTGPWQVMALVTVLGMLAASTWIPLVPFVQAVIPASRQGIVLGLAASGLAFGIFAIGFIAPLMIAAFGWRSVWFAAGLWAAILFVAGLVVLRTMPAVTADQASRHDGRAARDGDRAGAGPEQSHGHPASGAAARAQAPQGLASLPAILMIVVNFLAGLSFHPFQTYLTLYFRDIHLWSMPAAAALWSAAGLGGMAGGLAFGWLADRTGPRNTLVLANAILFAACLTVWLGHAELPVYAAMIFYGMAYNAIWGLFATWMARSFAPVSAARLMGFTLVASGIGGMAGNVSGGLITALPGGYGLLYMLVAGMVGVIVLLTAVLPAPAAKG